MSGFSVGMALGAVAIGTVRRGNGANGCSLYHRVRGELPSWSRRAKPRPPAADSRLGGATNQNRAPVQFRRILRNVCIGDHEDDHFLTLTGLELADKRLR